MLDDKPTEIYQVKNREAKLMQTFLALTLRELKAFWYSPLAYVIGALFLFMQGGVFVLLVTVLNDPRVDPSWARMSQLFFGGTFFFWISTLITAPLLTMRTFSEEKRTGTIEMLLSAPVTDAQVVLSKFLGAWLAYSFLWASTGVFFFMLRPFMAFDWSPIVAGYLGTCLMGSVLIAAGLLASSLTRNQVIAALLSFAAILALFTFGLLDTFIRDPHAKTIISYLSLMEHMRDFSRGILDTRPITLYLSLTGAFLFLTARVIGSPRWRS